MSKKYTWDDVARDLALLTHLTISQAIRFTMPLRDTDLSPNDATPHLRDLLTADPERQGAALYALLKGEEWGP